MNDEDEHEHEGYPAHYHYDKIPPWWEYVSNGDGGILSQHVPTIDNYDDDC